MRKTAILTMLVALTGCATTPSARPRVALEFRPGSETPGPGLTEMTVVGSGQRVYLSKESVLSNPDVESARAVAGPGGPQIEIVFTRAGAKRFSRATEKGIMKPLGILVDGQLISAPIVREKIIGRKAVISGRFSDREARRIADGISGR
jgi:preprotein translocase subunit SecD